MTHVFLVRHGQASSGTDNYDRLSPAGIEQARLLGRFWKQCDFRIDAAFSGSLERQQHTAQLALDELGSSLKVGTLEGLNEYDHSTIDRLYGKGIVSDGGDDLKFDQYVEIMSRWRDASATEAALSWKDFSGTGWATVTNAVDSHTQQIEKQPVRSHGGTHAHLAFFTSGGVIATILQQLLSTSFESTMHALWQTRNSSVTNLLFNKDGVSLVDYNTVAHLQGQPDKRLITQI